VTSNDELTRSTFLKKSAAAGTAILGGSLWATSPATARARRNHRSESPIRNLIISCQENRSFDHYFGYAPQVQAGGYGPPPGYYQPDASGGRHAPSEFTATSTPDISHSWASVHTEWDGGRMDGFYEADGANALGYYTARELPFYYSLFQSAVLCPNYFCSLLGPT
jgi:phospholipase C